MAEDTVIEIQSIKNETFEELLERLNLKFKECGDCFLNGSLASKEMPIPNNSRTGLFSFEMWLIDGSLYVKNQD